jgi:hypothetical protein
MNQILFEFVRKFTKSLLLTSISAWPTILLGEKTYRSVLGEDRIIEKLKGSGMQVKSLVLPLGSDFTFGDEIYSGYHSVVNSKGDIVALTRDKRTFKVFKRSGESRILCEAPRKEHASEYLVEAMDIDAEDNLYVITGFQEGDDQSWIFKLFIFDENGNKELECPLPFLQKSFLGTVRMAINKNGKIAILIRKQKLLYIGNVCVELNSFNKVDKSFHRESNIHTVRFSSFDGTIIAADPSYVYICTVNGELQCKIKTPILIGYGYFDSVAINHATKYILVKTNQTSDSSLLSFSETGELHGSFCLETSEWIKYAQLKSHPNGPVALVGETRATLLQL